MALYALMQSPWACCVVDCPKTGKSNCRPVTGDVLLPLRYLPTHMCHAHRKRNAVLALQERPWACCVVGCPKRGKNDCRPVRGEVLLPLRYHPTHMCHAHRQQNARQTNDRDVRLFQRATIQRVPTLLCDCMRAFDRVVKVASVASGKDR